MNRQRAQLVDRLELSGQDWLWYLARLSSAELFRVPGRDEWTAHQIAAHMRDTEVHVFLHRTERLLADEHPAIENFDQEAWSREHYLVSEPLGKIRSEFRMARRKLCPLLRSASRQDWENWALHPEYGRISLDWLVEHNYAHTLEHVAQIARLREATLLMELNHSEK